MADDRELGARREPLVEQQLALASRASDSRMLRVAASNTVLRRVLRTVGESSPGYAALSGVLRDWLRDLERGEPPGQHGDTAPQHAEECVRAGLSDDDVLNAASLLAAHLLVSVAGTRAPYAVWGPAALYACVGLELAAIEVALAMHKATPTFAPVRAAIGVLVTSEPSARRLGH